MAPTLTLVLLILQPFSYRALTCAFPSAQNAFPDRPSPAGAPAHPSGPGSIPGMVERLTLPDPRGVRPAFTSPAPSPQLPAQSMAQAEGDSSVRLLSGPWTQGHFVLFTQHMQGQSQGHMVSVQ